jgi:putative SbcD/Mre11-related phosphoesterase
LNKQNSLYLNAKAPLVDGWQPVPEGGAVHCGEATAVIADVHLGYEWARGAAGDCVPAHSLGETVAKLERLLAGRVIDRLIVAGDLVESPRPCGRTAADLARLVSWLHERGVRLVLIRGNHDLSLAGMENRMFAGFGGAGIVVATRLPVGGWTIAHGHRPTRAPRLITGHHHPVLRVSGRVAPCFLVGASRIILPAFSDNAAGLDLATARLPESWRRLGLRCLASTGNELLDFGPLPTLRARVATLAARR